ncbi:uncharacterized protein DEA37_0009252 [Paragonimus westermani]|uniref:Uncharacterized protein n=1 Tax=Paragonimus westermani TaxID=34504 RepID=A0A5J4NJJ5_9TREM|nr:uncharacterized protein DEA37_0009252 [Paragonimus westermani]
MSVVNVLSKVTPTSMTGCADIGVQDAFNSDLAASLRLVHGSDMAGDMNTQVGRLDETVSRLRGGFGIASQRSDDSGRLLQPALVLVIVGVIAVLGAPFSESYLSHQIFHVFVVVAAFVHYHGLSKLADYRLTVGDCKPTPEDLRFPPSDLDGLQLDLFRPGVLAL